MNKLVQACLLAASAAAVNEMPSEMKTINDHASFNVRYIAETEQVEFIVTMKQQDNFVGLVFGQTKGVMTKGDDMAVFFANGAVSSFEEYTSDGYSKPTKDAQQDLKAHPEQSVILDDTAGTVTMFARRALDTGDAKDYVIQLDTEFNLGYAWGDASNLNKSPPHTKEDSQTIPVVIKADGTPLLGKMPEKVEEINDKDDGNANGDNGTVKPTDDKGTEKEGDEKDGSASIFATGITIMAVLAILN